MTKTNSQVIIHLLDLVLDFCFYQRELRRGSYSATCLYWSYDLLADWDTGRGIFTFLIQVASTELPWLFIAWLFSCLQVAVVTQMVNVSKCMRCYLKGTSGTPLTEFSCFPRNQNDTGDCDGIPVFTFWSIFDFGMRFLCKLLTVPTSGNSCRDLSMFC